MGFDPSGDYLLTISHDGRGVFSSRTWERVARDPEPAYPKYGHGIGIGPIENVRVQVTEKDYTTEILRIISPDGRLKLDYDDGTITITENTDPYSDVAQQFAGFCCNSCSNYLVELPGMPYEPGLAWAKEMGRHARELGWEVEELRADDWMIHCPECRAAVKVQQ